MSQTPNKYSDQPSLSDEMQLNSIRLALLKRLGLAQSWHWNVYQQIFVATAGFLEWCETFRPRVLILLTQVL